MSSKKQEIQAYILTQIETHPADISAMVCQHFSVTRMTATRHLQKLIADKKIVKSGRTYDTHYYLSKSKNKSFTIAIAPDLDEFRVYEKYFEEPLETLAENQRHILEYCCTELINNAKDHSQGSRIHLEMHWKDRAVTIQIRDNGIGIFKKLQEQLRLSNIQEGLLTLTKGKITTDPKQHTGEGIFFSSRAVDRFVLEANEIRYIKDNVEDDWFYEKSPVKKGTQISLTIFFTCQRLIKDLFHAYMEPEDFGFDKTEILVELARLGNERYISRSQAKRILADLDRFSRIVLDFRGIQSVGQGFVDEVFRVFCNNHPSIEISYRNANDEVIFMIKRARRDSEQ